MSFFTSANIEVIQRRLQSVMTGVNSHPLEELEKKCALFISIFQLNSDAKYESFLSNFEWFHKYL